MPLPDPTAVEPALSLEYPALALERLARGPSQLPALPPGNAALPDLLALAGQRSLQVVGAPDGLWHGRGGQLVTLNRGGGDLHGEIASSGPAAVVDHVEAAARRTQCAFPAWASAALEVAAEGAAQVPAWGAGNPLPVRRHALIELAPTSGVPPLGVIDERGARHPLQRLRPPHEPERWITAMPLEPLQVTRLVGSDRAVATGHWEVSPRVLDNGHVRAEFDDGGRLERLCWDGVFASLTGPACQLWDGDGHPLVARALRVLEAGPVRAVIAISYDQAVVQYVLLAHQRSLELQVLADVEGLRCRLPLEGVAAPVLGDCLGVRAHHGLGEHAGISWALAGAGTALASGRGMAVLWDHAGTVALSPRRAGVELILARQTRVQLHAGAQLPEGLGLPLAAHLTTSGPPRGGHFRLLAPTGVAALWISTATAGVTELLLCELLGSRSRCQLFPACRPQGPANLVDAQGGLRDTVRLTAEGDGFQLVLAAHEIAILRWAVPA